MNKPTDFRLKKSAFCNTDRTHIFKNSITSIPTKGNKNPVKTDVKKILVRNTEKQVPETRVIKDDLKENIDKGIQTDTARKQTCTHKNVPISFEVPKPYTVIGLSKKIEKLEQEKQRKRDKLAADEKVLRNLNFPYDRPIYKDLIPLVCEKAQSPPSIIRTPLPQRDKEPILLDFVEIKKIPNYYILPNLDIENKIAGSRNNNLRLYKLLDINS